MSTASNPTCDEVRTDLVLPRGDGALSRVLLRRHVAGCRGCAEFRDEVRRQRAMVGALLPVAPSAGLKHGVLAAAGIGGGGAAAGGGAATGGAAAKVAAIVAAAGISTAGAVAIEHQIAGGGGTSRSAPARAAPRPAGAGRVAREQRGTHGSAGAAHAGAPQTHTPGGDAHGQHHGTAKLPGTADGVRGDQSQAAP